MGFVIELCHNVLQNENVNRPYTSTSKVKDLRRPDRRAAMKVLIKKSFKFVDLLWKMYIAKNRGDIRLAHWCNCFTRISNFKLCCVMYMQIRE